MMAEAVGCLAVLWGLLLVSQLSPGPDLFFVFRTALAQGFRAGAAVGSGIAAGFLIQSVLVVSIGAWLMSQPWSYLLRLAAAGWLLYLSWRIFPRRKVEVKSETLETGARETLPVLFAQGFLCNILNPKCTLFICGLSFAPLNAYASIYPWFSTALVVVLSSSCLAGWVLWSAMLQARPVRQFYLKHTTAIDALFAVLLAVFAVLLAL